MGWNINIITDKEILKQDVEEIVANLPDKYRSHLPSVISYKMSWGWSAYCDIKNPEGNMLPLSGSYGISGERAEEIAEYIKNEMKKIGYKARLEFHW